MIWHDIEQRTLAWQQLRLGIPTASEFHRIMTPKKRGFSSQAHDYMYDLLEEWWTGEQTEVQQNQGYWVKHGVQFEDEAVHNYEFRQNVDTSRGGFFTTDDGLIGCSPDRLVGEEGILEIKCVALSTQIRTLLTKSVSDHITQIQGQLLITKRKWCDVFSYHPKMPLDPIRVLRDEAFIRDLDGCLQLFVKDLVRMRLEVIERGFPPPEHAPAPEEEERSLLGVSQEDVDLIFASRRREQEEAR